MKVKYFPKKTSLMGIFDGGCHRYELHITNDLLSESV
jgi:hypothetical protein